jgi:chromosome partitioning protein
MSTDTTTRVRPVQVIVVGNEKGGSGKSTVAMHLAVALLKAGHRIASIDLDARQRSFTTYIQNRQAWASQAGRDLEIPDHYCFDETENFPNAESRAAGSRALSDLVDKLAAANDFIIIDTPGHDSHYSRFAHSIADVLITPINDSFVDFDVLGTVDGETFAVTGTGHYARMVDEARCQRQLLGQGPIDWIVLRNRLSFSVNFFHAVSPRSMTSMKARLARGRRCLT